MKTLGVYLWESLKGAFKSIIIQNDIIICNVNKDFLLKVVYFLWNNSLLKFTTLVDLWGVDYITKSRRFEINYLLISVCFEKWIWLKVRVSEDECLDSVVEVFKSAGWLEWEVWDMYGVYFWNNGDLWRILTDYGFEGFPLWKDFPLSGYIEVWYDDGEKRVLLEPIEMAQEYWYFMFGSCWEKNKH